jgi:4-hydroxyacetophenone monooxygenase
MAWGSDLVTSWYKSASGRVSQNWPLPTADYWLMTEKFSPDEYTSLHAHLAA